MILRIASVLALLAAFGAMIVLYKHGYILSTNPAAITIEIMAVLLMLWARITFGIRSFHAPANATKGELVTNGPYRWVRNPIYTSIIIFIWASVIAYPYLITIAAALVVTAGMVTRGLLEERFLTTTYPAYSEYARTTKRFIPYII